VPAALLAAFKVLLHADEKLYENIIFGAMDAFKPNAALAASRHYETSSRRNNPQLIYSISQTAIDSTLASYRTADKANPFDRVERREKSSAFTNRGDNELTIAAPSSDVVDT
jgi:hypothetical protein